MKIIVKLPQTQILIKDNHSSYYQGPNGELISENEIRQLGGSVKLRPEYEQGQVFGVPGHFWIFIAWDFNEPDKMVCQSQETGEYKKFALDQFVSYNKDKEDEEELQEDKQI